jgi:DNA repair exonuclease SbcCD nuclease subunit
MEKVATPTKFVGLYFCQRFQLEQGRAVKGNVVEETEVSWLQYSKYVLLTIDRLVDAVDKNEQEVSRFREELIKSLTKLKEEIRKENSDNRAGEKTDLDKALSQIDDLIRELSGRTRDLEKQDTEHMIDQKLNKLREKYIIPLRIKVAVISILLGALGGIMAQLISGLAGNWFHG